MHSITLDHGEECLLLVVTPPNALWLARVILRNSCLLFPQRKTDSRLLPRPETPLRFAMMLITTNSNRKSWAELTFCHHAVRILIHPRCVLSTFLHTLRPSRWLSHISHVAQCRPFHCTYAEIFHGLELFWLEYSMCSTSPRRHRRWCCCIGGLVGYELQIWSWIRR